MAEKTDSSIGESDLTTYLDTQSDFAFELTVLKTLLACGFTCEHGGSYVDPVTGKTRQFDLRATKSIGFFHIRLAVECKNLGADFPLLISCLPRRPEEAFHEIIRSCVPPPLDPSKRAEVIRFSGKDSVYKPREIVGKSWTRVRKRGSGDKLKDGEFYATQGDAYEKWAQAVNSAQDLIGCAWHDGERAQWKCGSFVMPVLAVPDEKLWVAEFNADGARLGNPRQVGRCSYFIGKVYCAGDKVHHPPYHVSHLEFVTLAGLVEMIEDLFGENTIRLVFPES